MILHVIANFSSQGGAQVMLARLLAEHGGPALVVPLAEPAERVLQLPDNPQAEFVPLGAASLAAMPGAVVRLARLIRQHRPQAVLCWMYHACVAGTLAARLAASPAPVFWTVRQALDDRQAFSRSTRAALRLARILSGQSAGIIYNSSRARSQHGAYGFAAARSHVIPNGFVLPQQPGLAPGPARRFGIAARFHAQKDYGSFFRAAALARSSCPGLRFAAAGAGITAQNPQLMQLLAASGLAPEHIDLCGELADMGSFYRSLDALVLSSRTEGFPNVLAEAMSYGRPVVTTDTGDAARIAAGSGLVVPPRDAPALAAAITRMAGWTAAEYGTAARAARARIAADYTLPQVAAAYRAVLQGAAAPAGEEGLPCAD